MHFKRSNRTDLPTNEQVEDQTKKKERKLPADGLKSYVFLQGDSYSAVGFCISRVLVCMLLKQSKGYRIGESGKRNVSSTHSFFVNDWNQYQESHKVLKDVSEIGPKLYSNVIKVR